MPEERTEYALDFLGRWYEDKVKRVYTEQDAERLIHEATSSLEVVADAHESITPEIKEEIQQNLTTILSVNGFRNYSRNRFTNEYQALEKLTQDRFEDVSEGHMAEYVEESLELARVTKKFVDTVRYEIDKKFPDDLTYQEVDSIFLNTYGSVDEYVQWQNQMTEKGLQAFSLGVSKGEASQSRFDLLRLLSNRMQAYVNKVNQRIFEDLEEQSF